VVKKWIVYTLVSFFVVGIGATAVALYLSSRIEAILRKELSDGAAAVTDGRYHISLDRLYVDIFKGEISFEGLSVSPDSSVVSFRNKQLPTTRLVEKASVKNAGMKGLDIDWGERKLVVDKVNLGGANVRYSVKTDTSSVRYSVSNASFHLNGLVLDKKSIEKGLYPSFDNFAFEANGHQTIVSNNNYVVSVGGIRLNSVDSTISIISPSFVPIGDTSGNKDLRASASDMIISGIGVMKYLSDGVLNVDNISILSPEIAFSDKKGKLDFATRKIDIRDAVVDSLAFGVGSLSFNNADVKVGMGNRLASRAINKLDSTSLLLSGLKVSRRDGVVTLSDISFSTRNLSLPLDSNCYTLRINAIDFTRSSLTLGGISLTSSYPMLQFASKSPGRQDWFGVTCDKVGIYGMDIPAYLSTKVVDINSIAIDNLTLKNFKNKKVPRAPKWMPLVYSAIYKLPVMVRIGQVDVNNMEVDYMELEKKGKEPGLLVFDKMTGTINGFTNVSPVSNQYITVNTVGRLMRNGDFTAKWMIPADSTNKYFSLEGEMSRFDISAMNDFIFPISGIKVTDGEVHDFYFKTIASSDSATLSMRMPYNNLRLAYLKEKDGKMEERKGISDVLNMILRKDNPSKTDRSIRRGDTKIERNPYHSTFNYFWQILRPGVAESVGISEKTQDAAMRAAGLIEKIRLFFHGEKGKSLLEKEAEANENMIFK
jgi:hypothetical protein